MKLPGVTYGPVQDIAAPYEKIDRSQQQLSDTAQRGLAAINQEVIKTQSLTAAAKLSEGLDALEADLSQRKYLSTQDVRDALGDNFDALPPETRKRLTTSGFNVVAGQFEEMDREDIPTWEVAGALYDKRAKELLKESSAAISIAPGWRADFEQRAAGEVQSRKARLSKAQSDAMVADLRMSQAEAQDTFARAGRFGDARAVVASSQVYSPAEKEKLNAGILKAEQQKPIFDAIQAKDVGAMRELRVGLSDNSPESPFSSLDEHERTTLASELDTRIKVIGAGAQARAVTLKAFKDAGGDPVKALGLVRQESDPDVAEEAEKMVVQRISEDHAVRVAADAPREGRLEQAIERGLAWRRDSDDYLALSDEGKARVEAKARAAARSNRAEGSQERREQTRADSEALYSFHALPLRGEDGKDQRSVDVDHDPLFQDVSPLGRARIKAAQQKSMQAVQKDGGVTLKAFLDKVTQTSQRLGYKAGKRGGPAGSADLFRSDMREQYDAWTIDNPGKAPPPDLVNGWIATAIPMGDDGGWLSKDKPAFQARAKGETWSPAKEQPANVRAVLGELQAGAPAAPAAPVRVKSLTEARALPKGTPFIDPDGIQRVR